MSITNRILLPFLFLSLVSSLAFMRLADPFEGTKWKVVVTPDDEGRQANEKPFDDTLIFKGGKFSSTACEKRGFKPVDFEEDTRRGPIARFTAEPVSEKEGKAKWTGTVTGSEIAGEMVWTKKDGTVLNYTFKGEKVH